MTISHKRGLDRHITPDAVKEPWIVMNGMLSIHEVLADIFGHCCHCSYVIESISRIVAVGSREARRMHHTRLLRVHT